MSGQGRAVSVYNQTRGTFLAKRVEIADSFFSRLIGLLGRTSIQPDGGIWILPANSIHTIGMMFRFDVVLIDKKYKVIGLRERIPPFWLVLPNFRAESVIEVASNSIRKSRTEVGDQLQIEKS